jgi:adenine deaminase
MIIKSNLIDIVGERIYPAILHIIDGKIKDIQETSVKESETYILPGLIDAHVHIESSMLVPTEFARLAVVHGTVATISDPHEIGNVLGVKGVEYMIENGKKSPFKFYFGAPSCVPATTFETAGATISVSDVESLLQREDIKYLTEMMNWPGVLYKDPIVYAKIALAKKYGKPVDGHAPGLKGADAQNYIAAGISTDHECFTKEEALDKLSFGMKILIREGSAAKNFEALIELMHNHSDNMMFCSDDKHPDSLVDGHINQLVKRALAKGIDLFKILKAACINPIHHYGLEVGMLRKNDNADFIIIDNPADFNILQTYINGKLVAENGKSLLLSHPSEYINNFHATKTKAIDFQIKNTKAKIPIIEVLDGELITNKIKVFAKEENGLNVTDIENDVLKIAVLNRYAKSKPAVAFIKNFGLKTGGIASSVAHDSHNIIAVGVDDESIAEAMNLIIENKGGIGAVNGNVKKIIPLPIAGLMTDKDGYTIAEDYIKIDQMVKNMGSQLISPFMSLSFMALLVIPSIKLSDLGLFDGDKFEFIDQ